MLEKLLFAAEIECRGRRSLRGDRDRSEAARNQTATNQKPRRTGAEASVLENHHYGDGGSGGEGVFRRREMEAEQ